MQTSSTASLPCLAAALVLTVFAGALLGAESQKFLFALLAGGVLAMVAARRLGLTGTAGESAKAHPKLFATAMSAGVIALSLYFHDEHFALLLIATVLVYVLACLGLNIQFGLAGVVNFSGASFFGVGGYVAAMLAQHPEIPRLVLLPLGGLVAALVGVVLIVPVLKTKGHYAALVTIAFALLFKTFLDVTDSLGGPQGLKVKPMTMLGWSFSKNFTLFGVRFSSYLPYIAVALALVALGFIVARRVENSWTGLNMDAIRTDETVSACFGLNITRWKITAFILGNFYCGLAGAFFAMLQGYIAPSSFTFGDSLILLSIVILGGVGSMWGTVAATCVVILLPEKFQSLQEYRFLIYATLVILILLFRPQGLLPRAMRDFAGLRRERRAA